MASGVDRIASAFAGARSEDRAALMPYMMGGFPDAGTAAGVGHAYVESGADLIELGVPFSDPLADGPVIHAAATTALAGGAGLGSVLATASELADRVPVIVMVYANMVLARGAREVAAELEAAGVAGAIVPDLPLEEGERIGELLEERGLALVPLVAPTTPPERRARIAAAARGFVYVVSDTRTTGERDELPASLGELVGAVKAEASVPAAVGFGISTPEQAAEVGRIADGVIIGSRLVRAVAEAGDASAAAASVAAFLSACRRALDRAPSL